MRKESTTIFLRRGFISTLALCIALLISCSSDSDLLGNGENGNGNGNDITSIDGEPGLVAEAHSKELVETGTRSSLNFDSGNKLMKFAWDSSDKLTVFAEDNYQAEQIYRINPKTEYDNRAHFSSTDFKLTQDKRYFALSKVEGNAGGTRTSIPDQKNILLDYSGQQQTGNASTAHLGKYDFMAASAVCEEEDQLHFDFQHLGATLRIVAMQKKLAGGEMDPKFVATKFTSMELYSSDNSLRQPLRNFDLSVGVNPDGTFTPSISDPDGMSVERFTIDLTDGSSNGILPTSGFNDGSGPNSYKDLIVYMEVPPIDLRGKTMGIILRGKDGSDNPVTYYGTHDGINIMPGKYYNLYFIANQTTDYTVTLKINHLWKYGNDVEVTRATGDPGYDKEFVQPNHLYYIFCVGGKVRAVKDISGEGEDKAYNYIQVSGTGSDSWSFDAESKISTYGRMLTFPTTDADKGKIKQLFVIAANRKLSETAFSGLANETPVSTVLALAYNIQTSDPQNTTQVFLRDLYSTPYETDASFVGNLNDPMQDVFLYHTAAKVDLLWNSTTKMPLTSADPTSLIKVADVKSTGLSLFKPTTNTQSSGYTVTSPITPGTYINGRQVYYLPQFADNQYNVTIGSVNYTDGVAPNKPKFTFSGTTTTGGFTSWLRALIQQ